MLGPGVFLVTLVVASAFTIFYLIKSRHLETMAKIEHGIAEEDKGTTQRLLLNLGFFFCFLGSGFIIAYLISHYTMIPEYAAYPASLLMMGGLSLISSFWMNQRSKK